MAKDVIEKDIDVMEPEKAEYSLSGGKFFEAHPEKVLAEPYEASGRFGNVTKYRPKAGKKALDVLKEIETPAFIGHGITDLSAGASVIMTPVDDIHSEDVDINLQKAVEKSEKNIIKKQRSQVRAIKDFEEPVAKPTIPFEDILRTYNLSMTDDEIKAYLWYMYQQGNTYRGKWLKFFNPEILSQEQESAFINSWVKQGILFYFRGELVPASIYLSENLYERRSQFDKDKPEISRIYGEEAVAAQEVKLLAAFREVYDARLKLDDPDEQRRLHLKPFSDFTNGIQVRNWNLDSDGNPGKFRVVTRSDGSINWYSAKERTGWRDTERETLSINEAFRWWLRYDPEKPVLPNNYTWEDIYKYYLDKKAVKNIDPTVLARNRALTKDIGDKYFGKFLAEVILENDKVAIETAWNELFNGDKGLVTDKIPIAFECALNYPGDEPVEVRDEKREAVAFACFNGSSLNAYQVGVGKTYCAIFTIEHFLDAGHCKRPFLIVPNQVYKQFYAEMHGLLPHRKINDLYNLSEEYIEKLLDENGKVSAVEEGSISMLTYEGFEQVGFNMDTADMLLDQLKDVIMQITKLPEGESKKEAKRRQRQEEKLEGMLGKALQKTRTNIEDLGFDFVCFDEAHALKNIFSQVKARSEKVKPGQAAEEGEEPEEKGKEKRGKKMYEITGSTSTRGIMAYMLCSYIQHHNNGRNVLLLTATPFTNSPLEVYSMLSLVAYSYLKKVHLSNINDFFDNYALMSYELVINSKLQPQRRQVFKAFDNLMSLQKLVYRFMLHKEAGKPDKNGNIIALIRPDKWVLPYKGRFNEKNEFIPASADEMVDTVLPLTSQQKDMMQEIIKYVEGKISYDALQYRGEMRENVGGDESEEGAAEDVEMLMMDEFSMDDKEKAGVRALRGVNFARGLALSPYLYEFSGLGEPTYKDYVNKSPKLLFVMRCIKSVKDWHAANGSPMSGQVIYMDRGKAYFELLRDYLVEELGFRRHEIGIIRSGKEGTAKHKDAVKNAFNGLRFDENTKSFSDISDEERIKIVIGTSSIKEGLNLQRYGTVLYNAFVDWNPTDEIQLEGRMWRQGNVFKNMRVVIPMMSDSMDIFMFQKLEEKTERINSLWNYDGKSNVLKVEEIDPKDLKLALVTDPQVIAKLEVEDEETELGEKISVTNSVIETAKNTIELYNKRDELQKQLHKVLSIINPTKDYPNVEAMMRDFEQIVAQTEEDEEYDRSIQALLRSSVSNRYEYDLIGYDFHIEKGWRYGNWKGAVTMLKKVRKSFLDKYGIEDLKEAVERFIVDQTHIMENMNEDKKRLQSPEYIETRAYEIEKERQRKDIKVFSVDDRIEEFKKLNYLLGIKRDDQVGDAEAFIYTEVEGCPPMKGEKRDVTPEGIKMLETCLTKIPQTKQLHTDETGKYTEDRLKLHRNIRARLLSGLTCRTERETPVAIITGGPPAAGKTSFLKQYAPNLTSDKIYTIDADAIRAMLPEYKGWNANATHKETQDIYRALLEDISIGKPCRFDILWDGTMNKAENYRPLIGDLKKLGYQIYIIYVSTTWKDSKEGVLARYEKSGRYVPMVVIENACKEGPKAFEELKKIVDGWMYVKGGKTKEIVEKGGTDVLAGRGYFDSVPTEADVRARNVDIELALQEQRIRILKLKLS